MVYSLTHDKFTLSQTSIDSLVKSLRWTCELHNIELGEFKLYSFDHGPVLWNSKRSKSFKTNIKHVFLSMQQTDQQIKDILCKK